MLTSKQYFGIFGAFGLAFWYGSKKYIAGSISDRRPNVGHHDHNLSRVYINATHGYQ
jgi:hypothetical protein